MNTKKNASSQVLLLFAALVMLGFLQHFLVIQFINYELTFTKIKNISFGLSYDIMNAAVIALLLAPIQYTPAIFRSSIMWMIFTLISIFFYIDLQYIFAFRTHIPFSHIEYLADISSFRSSILTSVTDPYFLIYFIVLPAIFFYFIKKSNQRIRPAYRNKKFLWHITFLILVSAVCGGYSNTNFNKNIHNPVISSPLFYFFATMDEAKKVNHSKPTEGLRTVRQQLLGNRQNLLTVTDYPLVREENYNTCDTENNQTQFGKQLCSLTYPNNRPNILFILLESFRAIDIGGLGGHPETTPGFDQLIEEGILFENFFANSYQTRHAIVATFCSLMPNYGAAILRQYWNNNFDCLPKVLHRAGYSSFYIQGSNLEFDNADIFLLKAGFEELIGEKNFSWKEEYLGWGYSDEVVFNRLQSKLKTQIEPFFGTLLSITNHHPFDVPEKYKKGGSSFSEKYYESMTYTSDQIYQFIQRAKQTDWYENTLIFVLADTSNNQPSIHHDSNFNRKNASGVTDQVRNEEEFLRFSYQIPLLIMGGKINKPQKIGEYAGQIDLATTVADLLSLSGKTHWAGRSLLKKTDLPVGFSHRPNSHFYMMSEELIFQAHDNGGELKFKSNEGLEQKLTGFYKQLSHAWILSQQWLLQEDAIWSENIYPKLGDPRSN